MGGHVPVLLEETLELLDLKEDGVYIDCTLGGGGHALAILNRLGPRGRLIGIEQDPATLAATRTRLNKFSSQVQFIPGNFRYLKTYLEQSGLAQVQGILFDLGVSSFQLDNGARGFSYHQEAPLDMRMDPENPLSAWKIVNQYSESDLTRIIRDLGEEKWARRIAQFITAIRSRRPIATTTELAEVVKTAIPAAARRTGPHPARRTFQALRIAVNDELEILPGALEQAIAGLGPGGRIVVISFHSLEDRIVKESFRLAANPCTCPADFPVCCCGKSAMLRLITRKPIQPSAAETENNPRSRSARLRAAEKI